MGVGGGAGGRFCDSGRRLSEVWGRWVEVRGGEVGEEGEES